MDSSFGLFSPSGSGADRSFQLQNNVENAIQQLESPISSKMSPVTCTTPKEAPSPGDLATRTPTSSSAIDASSVGTPNNILKDVVAYVEVRSKHENRSRAIEVHLQRLGARIESKLSKSTTHVVFKGGKHSTWTKAKKNGIPVVSVLWIESCKENGCMVPASDYPASIDEADTPVGLRRHLVKHKSMQPKDFEEEVANSIEKMKRKQKKQANKWKILQSPVTPLQTGAAQGQFYVADSVPRSPTEFEYQRNISIPVTPPSMRAARCGTRLSGSDTDESLPTSPSVSGVNFNIPLYRRLFISSANNSPQSATKAASTAQASRDQSPLSLVCDDSSPSSKTLMSPPALPPPRSPVIISPARIKSPVFVKSEDGCKPSIKTAGVDGVDKKKRTGRVKLLQPVDQPLESLLSPVKVAPGKKRKQLLEETGKGKKESKSGGEVFKFTGEHGKVQCVKTESYPGGQKKTESYPAGQKKTESYPGGQKKTESYPAGQKKTESYPGGQKKTESYPAGQKKSGSSSEAVGKKQEVVNGQCDGKTNRRRSSRLSQVSSSDQESVTNSAKTTRRKSSAPKMLSSISETETVKENEVETLVKSKKLHASGSKEKPVVQASESDSVFSFDDSDSAVPKTRPQRKSVGVSRAKSNHIDSLGDNVMSTSTKSCSEEKTLKTRRKSTRRSTAVSVNKTDDQRLSGTRKSRHSTSLTSPKADSTVEKSNLMTNESQKKKCNISASEKNKKANSSATLENAKVKHKNFKENLPGPSRISNSSVVSKKRSRIASGSDSDQGHKKTKKSKVCKDWVPCDTVRRSPGKFSRNIVTTSLHYDEQDLVESVARQLGGCCVEETVDHLTSHVVCGKQRRTLNVLYGLARHLWIVSIDWVLQSLEAGKWLDEEPFELVHFFPTAVARRCTKSKEDIFSNCGPVFVAKNTNPPAAHLTSLLTLCGAQMTELSHTARVCVGRVSGVDCVMETWVLDSIMANDCLPRKSYLMK